MVYKLINAAEARPGVAIIVDGVSYDIKSKLDLTNIMNIRLLEK
jgi:hypothetical protein